MTIISLDDKNYEEVHALQQQLQLMKELIRDSQIPTPPISQDKYLIDELVNERQAKEQALEEVTALYTQFAILKQKLNDLQALQKEHQQEKQAWKLQNETLTTQLTKSSENETLNKQLLISKQQALDEAETQLKIAQHHLAKKVGEVAQLSEQVDEQDTQIHALYRDIDNSRDLLQEIQQQQQQNQQHISSLKDNVRSANDLATDWENKYHQLYDKMQQSESQIKELKLIDDQYRRLQSLWTSFNTIVVQSLPAAEIPHVVPENIMNEFQTTTKRPYQNLFDISKVT